MTIEDMRALLGLGPEVSDADVVAAYAEYLAAQSGTNLLDDFRARYPAFDETTDDRINYWLTDAQRNVEKSVFGPDYDLAQMLWAAHNLVLAGDGGATEIANLPAGVTQMRSGSLSLSFDNATVAAQASGTWMATKYGAQFLALLKRHRSGIRTTTAGKVSACGWRRTSLLGGYGG